MEEGAVLGAELVIQDDPVAPELMGPGIDQRAVFQPLEGLLFDGIDGKQRGVEGLARQPILGGEVIPQDWEIVVEQAVAEDGFLVVFPAAQEGREFAVEGAPHLDFVFTVCDNAAGEMCPYWPGQPMTAHWGVEDPAAVEGTDAEKLAAFKKISNYLQNRIKLFTSLPFSKLDSMKIKEEIDAIGKTVD